MSERFIRRLTIGLCIASCSGCFQYQDDEIRLSILGVEPSDGQTNLPVSLTVQLYFDALLDPATLSSESVLVRSGALNLAVSSYFDPVRHAVVIRPMETASVSFFAGYREFTRYYIETKKIYGLWGQAAPDFTSWFETGDDLLESTAMAQGTWQEVRPLLQARCASLGCHAPSNPVLGLDLSSAEGIAATALNHKPKQLPMSKLFAAMPDMSIIKIEAGVGDPARSYLLYKIIGDMHAAGDPMPPNPPPLSIQEQQAVSDWVAAGAPLD